MTIKQASETVTLETHPGSSRTLAAETDHSKNDKRVTNILDQIDETLLATVSQKPNASTKVHFLQAKGGFFAIVTTQQLNYLALPGSQIQLPDTLLNIPGELEESRSNPLSNIQAPQSPQQVTDQAMILGAGLASRFVPVSGDLTGYAKPSVPLVGEDSVIVTLAKHLQQHGFKHILVNTYYKPDSLKEQLRKVEGLEFTFIDEDAPSGTAGGLVKALESNLLDRNKPILIMQGDAVTDADLSSLLEAYEQQSPLSAIGVKYISDEEVSQMALVITDKSGSDGESGYVQSFKEKPTLEEAGPNRLASIGFYVLSPKVFDEFVATGKDQWEISGEFDYAFHFFPSLIQNHPNAIYAHMMPQPFYWSDIGRPDQYIATVRDIYEGKLQVKRPQNASQYFQDGIIFWEDAREKAIQEGASLKGNLIVFNRRI